jgi:hypothetical protein
MQLVAVPEIKVADANNAYVLPSTMPCTAAIVVLQRA